MLIEEVYRIIDTAKTKDNDEELERLNKLKNFFKEFFAKYAKRDVNTLSTITIKEVITSILYLSNPYDIDEVTELLNKYPSLTNSSTYFQIIVSFIYYHKEPIFKEAINNCLSNNIINKCKGAFDIGFLCKKLELPNNTGIVFTNFLRKNKEALEELKPYFENLSYDALDIASYFIRLKSVFIDIRDNDESKKTYDSLKRGYKRISSDLLKRYQDAERIFKQIINEYIDFLSNTFTAILKEQEQKRKNLKKVNSDLEKLKKLLDTKDEIKNIDAILELCPNTEIKEIVLDYCIAHNEIIYQELASTYEKLRQNSDQNLTILFSKYNYDYDLLDYDSKEELKRREFSEIEDILKRLNKLNLINIDISKVDCYKLAKLEELINKGLINSDWLNKNFELLYKDNDLLSLCLSNISLLAKERINLIAYPNSLDILISKKLAENIYYLKMYGLKVSKETTNINFLANNNLVTIIEFIISLGMYQNLQSLDVLNYSLPECLCLKVSQNLFIPYEQVSYDEDLVSDLCPSVIPSDIEKILAIDCMYLKPLPKYLEKYSYDKETLCINGIYVAKRKVERNLGKLCRDDYEACFYAIIHNGYYTYKELENLQKELLPESPILSLVRS